MKMTDSGFDIAIQLQDLLNKNLKIPIYNIFRTKFLIAQS